MMCGLPRIEPSAQTQVLDPNTEPKQLEAPPMAVGSASAGAVKLNASAVSTARPVAFGMFLVIVPSTVSERVAARGCARSVVGCCKGRTSQGVPGRDKSVNPGGLASSTVESATRASVQ